MTMTIWQQRKQLLGNKSFFFFLLHGFITVAAGSMGYIVLTWHALSFHHNPLIATVLISFSFWMPSVFLSPLAGVIVDRYPRKQILMISNFLRLLSFVAVGLIMLNYDSLWLCCLSNLANGIIFTVLGPAAMAFVREIVPNDRLLAGNSTIDITIEVSTIVGMALAGVLIILMPTTVALLFIALLIGLGILMLFLIHPDSYEQHHNTLKNPPLKEFFDGLNYLCQRPLLIYLYALSTTIFIAFMISPVVLAPFIKTALHGTASDFARAEVIFSLGIISGGFIMPWFAERYGNLRCLLVAAVYLSCVFILISMNHSMQLLSVLYFFLGIGLPVWAVIASISQQHTEKEMQGRLQAISQTISSLCLMVVYITLAIYGDHIQLAHCYWFCAGLGGIALVFIYKIYQHSRHLDNLSKHH